MPGGELLAGVDGFLYGTALLGGAGDEGVVFRYSPAAGLRALVEFTGTGGAAPGSAGGTDGAGLLFTGGLAFGPDGLLYGVVPSGGTEGGGVVFRVSVSSPLQIWKSNFFGNPNAPDLGDADGDGVSNLLEYVFLTAPDVADPAAIPSAAVTAFPDGGRLAIAVPRDPARNDISIIVEVSETLLPDSWTILAGSDAGAPFSGPGYYAGDSAGPGLKSVVIRDLQPVFLILAALHPGARRPLKVVPVLTKQLP